MQGTFDVTRIPLGLVSDIEQRHVDRDQASREFGDVDRLRRHGRFAGLTPAVDPAGEDPTDVSETDRLQTPCDLDGALVGRRGDDHG